MPLPLPVSTAPDAHDVLLTAVAAAVGGTGPAVAPIPVDAAERDRALAAIQPERPIDGEHDVVPTNGPPADGSAHDGPGGGVRGDGRNIALIVPTSGSSGEPKAALLTAAALTASANATHRRLGGPGQWLLALPTTHVAGLQVLIRSMLAGLPPVVMDIAGGFDPAGLPAAVRRMRGDRAYISLVPTQLHRVLAAGGAPVKALAELDALVLGGAAAPAPLLERAAEAGIRVVRSYGMTESCGGCVYDGRALDGVAVSLLADRPADDPVGDSPAGAPAEGRISLGGPTVFSGYRLRPDLTADALVDGRFRTGDRGRWRADGTLQVLGRADEMIITGGVNVAPAAVEAALANCPDVGEAAVTGTPDPRWGQRVVAVVTASPGRPSPTLAVVRDHVGASLGRASAPRALVVVPTLPRLPLGKIDRAAISALAANA